ncbi:MAG: hypothetical protein MJZ82_01465 [Paludibacteraceae bacterium]|nr:hypothetical protein [Paludibacteraceae bacterium]
MEKFSWLILATLTLCSCHHSSSYFPKEMEEKHIEIVRFDNAVLNVRPESAREDIELLYEEYPIFMPVWVENILGIPVEDTTYLAEALPSFLNDTTYGFKATNERAKEQYADINDIQKELDNAFTKIAYLWPEWPIPTLYLFISGFNASILFIDDDLAAGVDMYLGSDYEYYNRVVYEYQKQTMRKECLSTDVVSAYLFRNIPMGGSKNRLLENMIYRGKVMYLLAQIMDQPYFETMGYTREQWDWCEHNERAIWNTIMDKRDLFKTEAIVLTSYLNEGPFTQEVSQQAPGRLGTWVGWQIVESYMHHNPEVTLQELMDESDAQKILEQSYYKP